MKKVEEKDTLTIEQVGGAARVVLNGKELDGVRRISFDMHFDSDKRVVIEAETTITLFPSVVNLQQLGTILKAELLCTHCGESDFITMDNGLGSEDASN
jgi:hypothetical protein